ncbi:MAG TPA: penicillin-insensitive murein endopeptidase [Thermomicrobiales bacterium]|nr:penicillin-insensitive murein endopeptidase [Thermomicrobiales bacterium]
MSQRGPLVIIALLAFVVADCSGPETIPTSTPSQPEPAATVAATATAVASPSPTPEPTATPTPAPSPTPVPICQEAEVAGLLADFVAAFNAADWARMSRLLPAEAAAQPSVPPAPGMDLSLFHGASIATAAYSGETTVELANGAELIARLRERHELGERWRRSEPSVQALEHDPDRNEPDAAAFQLDVTRAARDLSERVSTSKGIVNCRAGTIVTWQMADHPLPPVAVVSLSLNDIDGEPLRFLSADEHPYFDGYTLVHGSIQVGGAGALASVTLEVLERDAVVAIGELEAAARDALIGPFDDRGVREITLTQPLFSIDSIQFQAVDRDTDGVLTLRVRATTTDGLEAVFEYATPVGKLVLYRGDNRYLLDEEGRGGNDWVQPSVRDIIAGWQDVTLGDFSDMNGGPFPPHVSHQEGLDVDVWFAGYNELDAFAAETLLSYIDGKEYTSRIVAVFVAYQPVAGDPFHDTLAGYTLSDGRPALDVILPEEGHTGHFHVRFASLLDE